jgi:hypothetical protein
MLRDPSLGGLRAYPEVDGVNPSWTGRAIRWDKGLLYPHIDVEATIQYWRVEKGGR